MRKSYNLSLIIFICFTTATFSKILSETNDTSTDLSQPSYKFLDPSLAYKILSELDSFRPINNSVYFGGYANSKSLYHIPKFGLKNDPEYCNKHRAVFVENPEIVFEQANVVLGKRPVPVMKVLSEFGTDIMPHVGVHMPRKDQKQFLYDISPNASLVYTVPGLHAYKEVGSHFACLSQEVNHIPGHYTLKMKDLFAIMAQRYADQYQDKPQCFSFDKYFPKTWLLHDKESCQDFFAQIKTKAHKKLLKEKQIVYLSKVVNSHRGVGVTPLKAPEEAELMNKYKKGALCGQITQGIIVQQYIHNPLLLSGRKFDFRMYMLIASTNPLMVFYHDGDLRVSLYNYTIDSDDKKVLLTNLDLNKNTYKQAKNGEFFNGLDEEGLRHAQQWNFPRLQAHLLEEGVISDPNWLDNYLRPEFKKAMIHLIRMSSSTFLRRSTFYELFGLDFMLDADMNLWFIEANAGPCLDGSSITIEKDIIRMVRDHFEIVYSLLRSRMKRIVLLINEMIEKKQTEESESGEFSIKNSEQWKQAFKKVSMNYLEPEYQLSADNSFSLVIDGNREGKDMYMGFIDEECL